MPRTTRSTSRKRRLEKDYDLLDEPSRQLLREQEAAAIIKTARPATTEDVAAATINQATTAIDTAEVVALDRPIVLNPTRQSRRMSFRRCSLGLLIASLFTGFFPFILCCICSNFAVQVTSPPLDPATFDRFFKALEMLSVVVKEREVLHEIFMVNECNIESFAMTRGDVERGSIRWASGEEISRLSTEQQEVLLPLFEDLVSLQWNISQSTMEVSAEATALGSTWDFYPWIMSRELRLQESTNNDGTSSVLISLHFYLPDIIQTFFHIFQQNMDPQDLLVYSIFTATGVSLLRPTYESVLPRFRSVSESYYKRVIRPSRLEDSLILNLLYIAFDTIENIDTQLVLINQIHEKLVRIRNHLQHVSQSHPEALVALADKFHDHKKPRNETVEEHLERFLGRNPVHWRRQEKKGVPTTKDVATIPVQIIDMVNYVETGYFLIFRSIRDINKILVPLYFEYASIYQGQGKPKFNPYYPKLFNPYHPKLFFLNDSALQSWEGVTSDPVLTGYSKVALMTVEEWQDDRRKQQQQEEEEEGVGQEDNFIPTISGPPISLLRRLRSLWPSPTQGSCTLSIPSVICSSCQWTRRLSALSLLRNTIVRLENATTKIKRANDVAGEIVGLRYWGWRGTIEGTDWPLIQLPRWNYHHLFT